MANEDLADATPWPNLASKHSTHSNHLDSAGLVSDDMNNEHVTDSMPQPNFALKRRMGLNSDIETSNIDGPNPDGDTYVPPDKSADDLESDDLAETADTMPGPSSKRKKNTAPAAATKKTKPNAARKLNLNTRKQLADIVEGVEELLVLNKGHRSRNKALMIVEDLENSYSDLLLTKKLRISDSTEQEVKSAAISAIHQGWKAATTDTNNSGMGDSEVVMKGKVQAVTEQLEDHVLLKHLGDGPQWSK